MFGTSGMLVPHDVDVNRTDAFDYLNIFSEFDRIIDWKCFHLDHFDHLQKHFTPTLTPHTFDLLGYKNSNEYVWVVSPLFLLICDVI